MAANNLSLFYRNIRLDVISGIAVLLIIISHLSIPDITSRDFSDKIFALLIISLKFVRTGGWAGVDFIARLPSIGTGKMYWLSYLINYFSLSVLTGGLFTRMIEVPFLNLRNKYFPSETN